MLLPSRSRCRHADVPIVQELPENVAAQPISLLTRKSDVSIVQERVRLRQRCRRPVGSYS